MKLLRFLLHAAFAATLSFCLAAAAAPPSSRAGTALSALAERYYEAQVRFDPLYSGTLAGDNRFDDRLPITIAPAERQRRFAMYREVQRELASIDRGALGAEDALTHDLLARDLRTRLGFERFNDHLLPLQQMDAVPLLLAIFGGGQAEQPIATVAQHDAYLKRIARLPAWVDQAIANMREGMRRGIVTPKAVATATLTQLKALASEDESANPYLAPIRHLPEAFSDADKKRLSAAYRRTVGQEIVPAMQRLATFVEKSYLPACRESAGWGALPDGAAWYRQWVRDQTTTDLDPERIHEMGLAEVARLHGELARIAPRLGYDGDPHQLLAWVTTNERFMPYRSEAEILEAYRGIDARVEAALPRLFGRRPKAALTIRPEPELTRATASDHYSPPAEDGTRPGVFWAVIPDPAKYDRTGMGALFLHEGRPGHHFHLALQQEMKLPSFRKRTWINAFGEGWALYAETLGHEIGLYEDPTAYVGELRLEMARAARLVVDTGMHAKGWSREQALDYWIANVGTTPAQARAQIERYMAWPAQALGYKLGSLKIQALRARANEKLGARFDLAAFHDAVLAEGSLPLEQLEVQIDRWIKQRGG